MDPILEEQLAAAILTQCVLTRAQALGIQPDAALADPRWATLCTETMQLFNSWMAWDAKLALPAYIAAFGKPQGPPAIVQQPTQPAQPTTPTQPTPPATQTPVSGGSPTTVPTTPVVNPVAAAMKALGLAA